MCERSPLFLLEAKSIIIDLLKRTVELFDLSINFAESSRLNKFLFQRNQTRDYHNFTLHAPCKLNYNVNSDINTFVRRLYVSCRLVKSNLRSLHAAQMVSPNDFVVLDDETSDLIKSFKSRTNKVWRYFQLIRAQEQEKRLNVEKSKTLSTKNDQRSGSIKAEDEQRTTGRQSTRSSLEAFKSISSASLAFKTQTSSKTDEQIEGYRLILISFIKISKLYEFLLEQLYGIHLVRDSVLLQSVVISIIRLILFVVHQLRKTVSVMSTTPIRNKFTIAEHQEICRVSDKKPDKLLFRITEVQPENNDLQLSSASKTKNRSDTDQRSITPQIQTKDDESLRSDYLKVRNDNRHETPSPAVSTGDDQASSLDFDEDEFYRLANLERDDDDDF